VLPAANVEALFNDSNARLNENKQVAYHIERDLLQCKRWNQADRWLTERYIQHNPLIASGRTAIVQLFGNRPAPETCNDKLDAPIVAVLADGDLVTVVTAASLKDSKGQPYTTTWFDNSTIHQELLPEKRLASKNIVLIINHLPAIFVTLEIPPRTFTVNPTSAKATPGSVLGSNFGCFVQDRV
jgi:predicted SnoaL-like aldol condensation-catalyzing enzyme